jgi:hypothetical protein
LLVVAAARVSAPAAICAERSTWRPISATDEVSSSAAAATVWTLAAATLEASAAVALWREV